MVITITDKAAVAEGSTIRASCNTKSWETIIKNGRAKIYASEVGKYTITATALDGTVYTTILVCTFFGQFSTDIYSGTLVVTCIEDAGNGKSCNVRSCDDEYKVTDSYNLTQDFDSKLELVFLGIPAGKYLVTVDNKYVFYKYIESIENINHKEVELKQWLYKDGDGCPWNTGGWMKCLINSSTNNFTHPNAGSTNAYAAASVVFNPEYISYVCSCSADVQSCYYPQWREYNYVRGGASCTATFGTVKPLKVSGFTLYIDTNTKILASIRSGVAVNANMNIDAATILQRSTVDVSGMNINLDTEEAYLLFGNTASISSLGSSSSSYPNNPGGASYNYNGDIKGIWME